MCFVGKVVKLKLIVIYEINGIFFFLILWTSVKLTHSLLKYSNRKTDFVLLAIVYLCIFSLFLIKYML